MYNNFTKATKNMNFQYDNEGLWSLTHPKEAEFVTNKIIDIMKTNDLHIVDMTAGCGGNTISFILNFSKVTSIEIDKTRFSMLKNNVNQYNTNNIILLNGDCIDYLNENYNVFFFDPPWGGPDYKNNKNIQLYLSNIELSEIIKKIKNKLIVLKLPYNYDYSYMYQYTIYCCAEFKNIVFVFLINNTSD